jgi:hypothetical protein
LRVGFNTHFGNRQEGIICRPLSRSPAAELDLYERHTTLQRATKIPLRAAYPALISPFKEGGMNEVFIALRI